jgi:phenylacetaldehyde dehydrogenase
MPIAREEVFGPVISIHRYDDLDEVVGLANDSAYGLAASIWTNDLTAMHRLASRLKAGVVWGNCHGGLDHSMPFGGFEQSGLGREGGAEGVLAYLETKSVMIQL